MLIRTHETAASTATGLQTGAAARAAELGRLAIIALQMELAAYPKPGLVSLQDAGSHEDMDAGTFLRSICALRTYFRDIAVLGSQGAPLGLLQARGLRAEADMMAATGGVNTHRGAIFALGLLSAAAARLVSEGKPVVPQTICRFVQAKWGEQIALPTRRVTAESHGLEAARRYGVGGARAEAAAGFPTVLTVALPAYEDAMSTGCGEDRAQVQACFASLAVLDDTNLLHRGGLEGLAYAKTRAKRFLDEGGVHSGDWETRAEDVHRAFCARRLSPGGTADIMAAAFFLTLLGGGRPR